jgi:hypothetical protein
MAKPESILTAPQALLLSVWIFALGTSVFLYGHNVVAFYGHKETACSLTGWWSALLQAIQPSGWVGIMALILTVFELQKMLAWLGESKTILFYYRGAFLSVVGLLVALYFSARCY